jgi:UDPglucose 6-dehydrogenase
MHIAMVGSGYVGLVSGACFADFGHTVVCVDRDAQRISALKRGECPIFEPGLDNLIARNMREGRLAFTTDLAACVPQAQAVFIAVGTPSRRGDGHADLSYVYAAAREIAVLLRGFTVVVTKSTVPVGTGDEIEAIFKRVRPDADVAVVSNPEFLREGQAVADFQRPDRVVLGSTDPDAARAVATLYLGIRAPIIITDLRTAEMIKYASNAFLATKISFINEMARICEELGANVKEVALGMGYDRRIGAAFLDAGIGFGGLLLPEGRACAGAYG